MTHSVAVDLAPAEKRKALDLVVHSRTFARCDRLRSLLEFLCLAEIEGRADKLNEYAIGVEALGRPSDFSPAEDSSVRSRAYELRQRLERFYTSEAPEAAVRIDLPKGSHVPRFVAVRDGTAGPPAAAPNRFSKRWIWAGVGGFLCGTLATVLGLAWWIGSNETARFGPVLVQRGQSGVPWTPELEAIWRPLLDGNTPVMISFETRLFIRAGNLAIRDVFVNDMGQVGTSKPLTQIQRFFSLPLVYEDRNYADFGAVHAVCLLAQLLGTRKPHIPVKRSVDLTWDDIRNNHMIFLGKPMTDPQLRHFLAHSEFVDEGPRVRVVHPRPAEPPAYVEKYDSADPTSWAEKYAVITLLPGPQPGRRILSLAGSGSEHPWAIASYLTDPVHAKQMVSHVRLPSGEMPESYQVVIRARFKGQEPTQVEYMTHRVLPSGAGEK